MTPQKQPQARTASTGFSQLTITPGSLAIVTSQPQEYQLNPDSVVGTPPRNEEGNPCPAPGQPSATTTITSSSRSAGN